MNVQTVRAFKLSLGSAQDRLADPQQHQRCLAASKQVEEFNKTSRASWHGWITITGPALIDCETTAQQRKLERGGRYEGHMSVLLKLYKLDDDHFDHTARAHLIHIMKNLNAVSEWRIRQPNPEILNNPTTVWRNFCNRAGAAHDKKTKGKLGDIAALTETIKVLQQRINDLEFELADPGRMKSLHEITNIDDEYYTPAKAIEPLFQYIPVPATIWCPFDTEKSLYVRMFRARGNTVIASHIDTGQDFCNFQPKQPYDYTISNLPFSLRYEIFQRLFALKKPFAMLVGAAGLFESSRFDLFRHNDFELMFFNRRISFFKDYDDPVPVKNPPFSSIYVTHGVLPKPIVFETVRQWHRSAPARAA
jgi:hypothetical protein